MKAVEIQLSESCNV